MPAFLNILRHRAPTPGKTSQIVRAAFVRIPLSMAIALVIPVPAFAGTDAPVTPRQSLPRQTVNQFQKNAGVFPGFRRNHAKGVCISRYLTSSGRAARYSVAQVFAERQ